MMAITVPDLVFNTYKETVDYMILRLGIICKIFYPDIKQECGNCYYNTLMGVSGSNLYKTGGPYPFTDGVCPYCNGDGFKTITTTENIRLRVYFDRKSISKLNFPIAIKDGSAVIIGYMSDEPKLRRAAYIQMDVPMEGYNNWKYVLDSEIIPWGILKDRYCTAAFRRA